MSLVTDASTKEVHLQRSLLLQHNRRPRLSAAQPEARPFKDPKLFERKDSYPAVLVEVITTLKIPKDDGLTYSPCMMFFVGHTQFKFSADEISDLIGFRQVQQLTEEEMENRVGQKEHRFMHYVLSHSICGRFDVTSSVSHADMLCLYGMVKRKWIHMGVVVSNLFTNQYQPRGMQLLTAEVVEKMRDKIGVKRARPTVEPEVRMEKDAYGAHPDVAGPAHVEAGEGSSIVDFQQQVLAQLAPMNIKVNQIFDRIDAMEAANAQGREEAESATIYIYIYI
nr:hypothetical protein Iba_chr04eCG18050 [Ipomoea batatas]